MDWIGKYRILSELGRGAMGVVYLGEDPLIGRRVAVKTIRFDNIKEQDEIENAQKRFMREAVSAGNLSHPNIVTIYEVGEDEGLTFIAMVHFEGERLEDQLAAGMCYSPEEAIALMTQLADALDYAHSQGVIHRDIKPGNILIDTLGRPHIVDFGIARVQASTMTQTNTVMGTPYYMSPEQVAGRKVDSRADVFALGVVLYEILTGEKPFSGETLTTVLYKIFNERPLPTRSIRADLPEGLDYVISRALAKSPEDRYGNCLELARDLEVYSQYADEEIPEVRPLEGVPEMTVSPEGDVASATSSGTGTASPMAETIIDSSTQISAGARNRKPLLIVLGAMMGLVVIVAVALMILTGKDERPRIGGGGMSPVAVSAQAKTHLDAGSSHLESGNLESALSEFEQVLTEVPDHYEARMNLANIFKQMGRHEEAIPFYESLIKTEASDVRPYKQLGDIYAEKQDLEQSIRYYRRYLDGAEEGDDKRDVSRAVENLENRLNPGGAAIPENRQVDPKEEAAKTEENPEDPKTKTDSGDQTVKREPVIKPVIDSETKESSFSPGKDFGISITPLNPYQAKRYGYINYKGILITRVSPLGAAALAGLKSGDIIIGLTFKGRQTRFPAVENLRSALAAAVPGDTLVLVGQRKTTAGETTDFVITIN